MAFYKLLPHGMMALQVSNNVRWHLAHPSRKIKCPKVTACELMYTSYRFQADSYGSSWYHSHYSAQYAGGVMGPLIVHGPSNYDYDIDLGPVFLSDCT